MTDQSFLVAWNDNFEFKMTVDDLNRPTADFMIQALKAFLKELGLHISQVDDFDTFYKYVKHLCQIADREDDNFYYIDQISPLRKKTLYIFQRLNNYYCYYRMVADELLDNVNAMIKLYEPIKIKINQLQVEDENTKKKNESIDRKLKTLNTVLPNLKNQNLQHLIDCENIEKQRTEVQNISDTYDKEYFELTTTLDNLKTQLVTNAEADELLSSIENIQKELDECIEIEKYAFESNQETIAEIKSLDLGLGLAESIIEKFNTKDFYSLLEIEDHLDKLGATVDTKTNNVSNLIEDNNNCTKTIESYTKIVNEKTKILINLQENHKYEKIESDINDCQTKLRNQYVQLNEIDEQIKTQRTLRHFIMHEGQNTLVKIRKSRNDGKR